MRAELLKHRLAQLLGWWGEVYITSYLAEQWNRGQRFQSVPLPSECSICGKECPWCSLCTRGSRTEKATQRMAWKTWSRRGLGLGDRDSGG